MKLEISSDLRLHSFSAKVLHFQTYQATFSNALDIWFNTMLNRGVLGNTRAWRSSRKDVLNGYTPPSESLNCFNKVTSLLQKNYVIRKSAHKCAQTAKND